MTFKCVEVLNRVHIEPSIDLHAHLRNSRADGDGRMELNMRQIGSHHEIIVHIGNGLPAILDQTSADQELAKANVCLEPDEKLQIFAGPLMTDKTTPAMIMETRMHQPRNVLFWKAFLSGVSNDGGNSVTDFKKMHHTLRAFYDSSVDASPMPLHIHAERKRDLHGKRIPIEDREWYAIRKDVSQLLTHHPDLTIVIKHVSDWRTIEQIKKWRQRGFKIFAEVCPHYLYRCHDDLFEGPGGGTAFNLHDLCWPIYKDEKSMIALRELVLSGVDWVMLGTDWACHNDDSAQNKNVKVNDDGIVVGGVTILPGVAKSIIIDLFVEAGCIENINSYISSNARRVHGLPAATMLDQYDRIPWEIPLVKEGSGAWGKTIRLKPFMRGQVANWQIFVPQEL
jgi:dihydroorotase